MQGHEVFVCISAVEPLMGNTKKHRGTYLAEVAELVDALRSGRSRSNPVEVQVLSSAHFLFFEGDSNRE